MQQSTEVLKEQNALISVSNKEGIVPIAQILHEFGYSIISTGGTAKTLESAGIPVVPVEKVTGFPKMLDGRVQTLAPQIHAGILADTRNPKHEAELKKYDIVPIRTVVVNLYPFAQTVAQPGVTLQDATEHIDIGGVALLRAAAKNWESGVIVLSDPDDYARVIEELQKNNGEASFELRKYLATKVFNLTSSYDAQIADYLERDDDPFALHIRLLLERMDTLRYGQNPHQRGVIYTYESDDPLAMNKFVLHQGKHMSFNNWWDVNAVVAALGYLGGDTPACVITKHGNPCGAAYGMEIESAFQRAWDGDSLAAFGGIVGFTRPITKELAQALVFNNRFIEVVVAPDITLEAGEILAKKKNLRILTNPAMSNPFPSTELNIKQLRGAYLVEDPDTIVLKPEDFEVLTDAHPMPEQIEDMVFAYQICRTSLSNTIVLAKQGMLVSSMIGQQDRMRCCKLAVLKSVDVATGEQRARGCVAASDGFFPFADGPKFLIDAGVTAIIQPGGSIRDGETIDLCNKYGIVMVTTGKDAHGNRIRGFKH